MTPQHTYPTCRACKKGKWLPFEATETFNPPTGPVEVVLLRSRCDRCGCETVTASQVTENIARRTARKAAYGEHLLGEDILALRSKYGLTKAAAGRIFGKTARMFGRYENEKSFPDKPTRLLLVLAMRHILVLKELAEEANVTVPLLPERLYEQGLAGLPPDRESMYTVTA